MAQRVNIEVLNKAAVDVTVQNSNAINVEVPTAPRDFVPRFTADKTEVEQLNSVDFSASEAGFEYYWEIEDGSQFIFKNGKNVSHQYDNIGEFDVALTQADLTKQTSGIQVKRNFIKVVEPDALLDKPFALGATAAYSLRKLKSTATRAVRVREDSGNTEADIGFSGGTLDETALLNHCGSNNGFVTKWYDQSGNGNDASQSTASNQPKIVSSASVITENGKPAIQAIGSQTFKTPIKANEIITTAGENTTITVFNCDSSKRRQAILGRKDDPKFVIFTNFFGSIFYDKGDQAGNRLSVLSSGTLDKQNLASFFGNGDQTIRYNGTNIANSTTSGTINVTTNNIFLLSVEVDDFFKGTVQEIILYPEAKDNQISDIETNINDFYSIF